MKEAPRKRGDRFEEIATDFLQDLGYKILDRNVHSRTGELDIVAQDDETVVFVEVRMRSRKDFGTPAETVKGTKLKRLLKQAEIYLYRHRLLNCDARIDIISIYAPKNIQPTIEHFINVSMP